LVDKATLKSMLKFSIPYIPTTMMWLITSVSDRYIVTAFEGTDVNGLYAASYKIPTLVSLASGVFIEAWQLSSVKDSLPEERASFFENVYKNYMSLMFMGASVIVAGSQIFTKLLLADSYYVSWKYVPILVIATTFSALSAFLGSVYFVEKKSMLSMLTAMSGAIINVILNFVLIPTHGAMGAAVATLISYVAVYVIRATDIGIYVKFKLHYLRVVVNTGALWVQGIIMIEGIPYWKYMQIALLLFMLAFNGRGIVQSILQIFSKKVKKI
jgi:O-antigen/teichoic acid export membrane protein